MSERWLSGSERKIARGSPAAESADKSCPTRIMAATIFANISSKSSNSEPTYVRTCIHIDVRVVKNYDAIMVVKPSRLRANLYRLLDHVLRTGEPIEIDRGGKKLLIVPKEKQTRLNNLVRRDIIVGDPEDLVHLDWSKEWRG